MRSQGAPVSALTGFMVMLPQSLNQMSRWMRSDTVTSKPARCSSAARPAGPVLATRRAADDQAVAIDRRTAPGAGAVLLRCTTQPTT
jgi:hypothetical protein